ncbi:unnamed protein product [Sphagnum balticum]
MQQFQRTRMMDHFKWTKLRVLVASDVAARGLDVKDIEVMIIYHFSGESSGVEDYLHRIGCCRAFPFFTPDDAKRAPQLIGVLTRANQATSEEIESWVSDSVVAGTVGEGASRKTRQLLLQEFRWRQIIGKAFQCKECYSQWWRVEVIA